MDSQEEMAFGGPGLVLLILVGNCNCNWSCWRSSMGMQCNARSLIMISGILFSTEQPCSNEKINSAAQSMRNGPRELFLGFLPT